MSGARPWRLANQPILRNWLLSGGWHKGRILGGEVKTEFGSLALEVDQFALVLLAFIALIMNPLICWVACIPFLGVFSF